MPRCMFDIAWRGRCQNEVVYGGEFFCAEHLLAECAGCGEPAIRSCDHTGGFVCGAPLCNDCKHAPPDPGSPNLFGMGGRHMPRELAAAAWEAAHAQAQEDQISRRLQDALEAAKKLTPEQVFQISVRAGIHNPDGTLTKKYGGV